MSPSAELSRVISGQSSRGRVKTVVDGGVHVVRGLARLEHRSPLHVESHRGGLGVGAMGVKVVLGFFRSNQLQGNMGLGDIITKLLEDLQQVRRLLPVYCS